MTYYKQNNNIIEKYIVKYNKEEIEKLKLEIINNCSDIEHCSYEIKGSIFLPKSINYEIKNLKYEDTEKIKEQSEERRLCSYDKYNYPELVVSINKFLNDDTESLTKLYNYEFEEYTKKDYSKQINDINNELTSIDDLRIKKEKLIELEKLINYAIKQDEAYDSYNKKQQLLKSYHLKLMELINLELVDTIEISKVNEIENFFDLKEKLFIKKKND